MAAAVENDIDDFIRNQKAKLQQERQYLNESERVEGVGRKQWDRNGDPAIPLTEQKENVEPVSEGFPLDNSKADARKEQLRRERQQEYLAYKEQNAPKFSPKPKPQTPEDVGLRLGGEYEKQKKKLDEEHKQNFLQYFEERQSKQERTNQEANRRPRHEVEEGEVPRRPEEARPVRQPADYIPPLNLDLSVTKRDYSPPRVEDYTARQPPYAPPKAPGKEIELSEAEKRRQQFAEERQRDYKAYLQKRDQYNRARDDYERNRPPSPQVNGLPPRPPPSQPAPTANQGGGLFSNLGKHDEERQKLNDERRKDYQQLLAETSPNVQDGPSSRRPPPAPQPERDVRTRGNVGPDSQNYVSNINTLRPHNSAEFRKQKLRNEEYNEFLKQKQEQEKHRFDDKKRRGRQDGRPSSEPNTQRKGDEGIFATLPGIHYNGSAQQRKMRERNQEYNEFLRNNPKSRGRQGGPKAGWQTPTYDEILDRKRQEEAQYRREDPAGLRPYASEGAINTLGADDDRYRRLDQELDDK